jgi:hypothetical protein
MPRSYSKAPDLLTSFGDPGASSGRACRRAETAAADAEP